MAKRYQDRFDGDNSPYPEDKVDWSDLGQVVDAWEEAKAEYFVRVATEKDPKKGFEDVAQELCCERELPQAWVEKLVSVLDQCNHII